VEGSGGEAFSSEIWDWAVDKIPRVAAKYPDIETAELEAELAKQLLEIRRDTSLKARDWKAYLIKCLLNHASHFAKKWRRGPAPEPSTEVPSSFSEPTEREGFANAREAANRLSAIRRQLGNADRKLLKQLAQCEGNVSRLARLLGQHRNTIHRRLRRIARTRRPIEIESAPLATGPPDETERTHLVAIMQFASARQILRARVILALLDGFTYAQIVRNLGASASTIARWRRRFTYNGIAGLKPKHPGKGPSRRRLRLANHLRDMPAMKRPSIRQLARQFGVSKSTAQRIVSLVDNGALSRLKTL
jgi:transposase